MLAGSFFLFFGLGVCFVENAWDHQAAGVALIGILCILFCLTRLMKASQGRDGTFRGKKWAILCLLLVFGGAVLAGINYLAHRYDRRWDLTRAKQHTLTQRTASLLKELKAEVKITALYVGIPPKYVEDLLKEYERFSAGKVSSEIIDPLVQIGYAAQFGHIISGQEKKVIIQSAQERRDIDFTDSPLSEEQLTNAVIGVTREARTVYFLVGHGEYDIDAEKEEGLNTFTKALLANNIKPKNLMLGLQERIPEDCDLLVIAGPKEFLTEKEEVLLEEYLEKGGDALILIEHSLVTTPDKPLTEEEKQKNPSLNSILKRWGIEVAQDVVVDLASHASGDVGCPATRNYMTHKAIVKDLDYTFYIRPRSISLLSDRSRSVKLAPLVLTSSGQTSWGETDRTLHVEFNEQLDRPGPVPIAYVIWEPRASGSSDRGPFPDNSGQKNKLSDTRLIVFTDADFLTNAYIGHYSNAQMGLNLVKWLTELDYQIFVQQDAVKVERLDLTSRQKRLVAYVLFLMPVLIAMSGVVVWMRQES
ncbi:MAG: hypothetical protein A2Y04_00400 [Omnitrophica WOR_2 bacterium GWC2_45_7]|nr:MAG: hypothetical protein A2Z81_00970 [Omnitrophica WOR_2 bacterium GWA2_45_18]OGX19405.1 MAG: hypothetical protein A2Y04_00400 [Omnitrophica WOR_2 bacterium GWC2_45_7]